MRQIVCHAAIAAVLLMSACATAANITAVDLGGAANFAILSKTGVTNVPTSAISGGNVGSSPITGAAILLTCPQVTGTVYKVDVAGDSCFVTDATLLATAVANMATAYLDAAGRVNASTTNLGAGEIGGLTMAPGLHMWTTSLLISTDVTLSGSADSIWIFQVAGTLSLANGKKVTLSGGALSKNIFWQVAGGVTVGTTATMEGILLSATSIALNTGSVLNGRALAQTAVTLQSSTVTASGTTTSPPSAGAAASQASGSGALSTLAALLVAVTAVIMGSTM